MALEDILTGKPITDYIVGSGQRVLDAAGTQPSAPSSAPSTETSSSAFSFAEPTHTITGTKVDPNQLVPSFTFPPHPVAAPAAPVAAAPTIGEQLAAAEAQAQRIQSDLAGLAAAQPTYAQPTLETQPSYADIYGEPVDQRAIQREQLRLHQAEIDAVNRMYDEQLAQARLQQTGRLGSQRAMAARGGILGSDFAASQKERVQEFGRGIERGIQSERVAAVGAIMQNVRSSVQQELAEKRAARQQGAENYLAYLSGQHDRRQRNLQIIAQSLLAQDIDPKDLDQSELQAIAGEGGFSVDDILNTYQVTASGLAGEAGESFTLKEGERRFDAAGNLIAEGKDETIVLKEGDLVLDADGNVVRKVPKTTASKAAGTEVYTSKDIPGDVRADLVDDVQAGQTVEQLIGLYPEVNLETIQDFVDQFAPIEESPGFFGEGGTWDAIWGGIDD